MKTDPAGVKGSTELRIGWLCIFGAGVSMLAGLLAGHFVRPRRRRRRRESNIEAFLREEFPGFIPFAISGGWPLGNRSRDPADEGPVNSMTDHLGRLLLVTLEAAGIKAGHACAERSPFVARLVARDRRHRARDGAARLRPPAHPGTTRRAGARRSTRRGWRTRWHATHTTNTFRRSAPFTWLISSPSPTASAA